METTEKLLLVAAIAGLAWIMINKARNGYTSDPNYTPWYLSYNYPTGFTGGQIVMPQQNVNANDNIDSNNGCLLCNIFPSKGGTQF